MERVFYLLITGPKPYLPGGPRYEKLVITQEDIDEAREEGESDDEVVEYIIEEEIATWEQHWCQASVLTEDEYKKLHQ